MIKSSGLEDGDRFVVTSNPIFCGRGHTGMHQIDDDDDDDDAFEHPCVHA